MKLASIEKIEEISPIEGADKIEVAKILGWRIVIPKNTYKVDDLVVFVPIDTIIEPKEWNSFLIDKNNPSKPIIIRTFHFKTWNQVSQGICFPMSILPEGSYEIGEEVSVLCGVMKYERPIPVHLAGLVAGNFPSHIISKTDEDNLLSNPAVYDELLSCDFVELCLKMDGTSGTFIKHSGEVKVCSRKLELKRGDSIFWRMVEKYNLEEIIPDNTSIQFETCGPSILGNQMGLSTNEIYIFNYKDLVSNEYLDKSTVGGNGISLPWVKQVEFFTQGTLPTIDELQEIANKQFYENGNPAEGIVIRGYNFDSSTLRMKLAYSNELQKMLSVKIINQNYKD